jgi:hypothetical protein
MVIAGALVASLMAGMIGASHTTSLTKGSGAPQVVVVQQAASKAHAAPPRTGEQDR